MIKSKISNKIKKDSEALARRDVLEELFVDFHKSRVKVYWFNLVRGIFFGVGYVIGGTLVIALLAWLLSLFTDIPGGIGDFIQYIVNTVKNTN